MATRRGQLLDTLKLSQAVAVALMVGALWFGRAGEPGAEAVVGRRVQLERGPGRKPGASSYTLTRLSLSLSGAVQLDPRLTPGFHS